MRDEVSWGFYIGNFTFMEGIAAAAIMLVIPAYVYNWKPLKEIVFLGELLAISAIVMCVLFIIVDMGQPARLWHMIPFIGKLRLGPVHSGMGLCSIVFLPDIKFHYCFSYSCSGLSE